MSPWDWSGDKRRMIHRPSGIAVPRPAAQREEREQIRAQLARAARTMAAQRRTIEELAKVNAAQKAELERLRARGGRRRRRRR